MALKDWKLISNEKTKIKYIKVYTDKTLIIEKTFDMQGNNQWQVFFLHGSNHFDSTITTYTKSGALKFAKLYMRTY